jgi:hypothetical protein
VKPIKPKPLSKRLRTQLQTCAEHPVRHDMTLTQADARAILAALEHERQSGIPSNYHVHLSAPAGGAIEDAAKVMCRIAQQRRQFVHMTFNGVDLTAHEGTTFPELVDAFYARLGR